MFESLSTRLQDVFDRLKSRGKLTDKDIDAVLREVKLSFLEADVNFKVVKDFTNEIRVRALGANVLESLTPSQQVIKIVHEELISMLGGKIQELKPLKEHLNVLMVAGLQGSGKTTTCAKIARYYQKNGYKPLLCALDVYRPAAIDQLIHLGGQIGVEVMAPEPGVKPVDFAPIALKRAKDGDFNLLILDTAGRLH
ncbi:MAG: signal recognition particle receptor subunit alpha, partial [Candidatus Wallbacteria bacterium]|nr:signal recognition particle receptor subunit alpha [Candidatus Wallbacteria bacterium]